MKLTSPNNIGRLGCSVCQSVMDVRQRSNGQKLLYTYCPKCKNDQRSSEEIQAFWRENMHPLGTADNVVLASLKPDPKQEAAPKPAKTKNELETDLPEWAPEVDPELDTGDPEDKDADKSVIGYVAGGLVCGVLLLMGFNAVASN